MTSLADVYSFEGKYAQAESIYSNNLGVEQRVLGVEHPETLRSMNNLADAFELRGQHAAAEALFRRTLEISRRALGAEHSLTLVFLSDVGSMYQRRGKYALAQTYAVQALTGRRHASGSESPDTMASAADLALAYLSQGKFGEAELLARESFTYFRNKQPEDWQRFRAESLLGASLAGQKKYAEAEPLLIEGYQGMAARKERIDVPDWYHWIAREIGSFSYIGPGGSRIRQRVSGAAR